MDARGTPPQGPPGEQSPWPHRAAPSGTPQGQPARPAPRPPGAWPGQPQQPPPSPAYGAPPQHPQPWSPHPPPSPAYGMPTGTIPQQQHLPHQVPSSASAPRPPRRTPDGRTTLSRVLRAWWAGRIRRLVPRGVPWSAVAFAIVLLAAWVLFADILLTPDVVQEYPGQTPSRDWGHDVVGWIALQITFGLGFASATMLLLTGKPWHRWVAVAVTLLSSAITLEAVVSGPGQGLPWIAGVGAAGLAASSLAVLAVFLARPRVHLAVASGVALAIQWGLVTWVGAVEPTQWVFLKAWTDLAFPVVVIVGFVAILAVALYAQQVHRRADRIGRRILLASWVPIVAAAVALAVVVVRMGPLSRLFGELDANLWGIGPWQSWPHAALVGVLVVWLVARSGRRPLRPRGHLLAIGTLAVVAGWSLVSFLLAYLLLTFVTDDGDAAAAITASIIPPGNIPGLALLPILLLVPVLVPYFRRSTGRVGAIVGLAVALPLQLWLVASIDLELRIPRFTASPSQIAFAILVLVLAIAIVGAVRRRDVVDRHLLLRLALVPVLTLHAGQLLPGVWKDDLEQALVVVLSLAGLLLLGIPRTGTKEGNARAIVIPFAAQVAVLGSVIVARTMGALTDDETTTISVLYLTIPLSAVLCCRLEDPSDAWIQRASTVDLQTMRRGRAPGPVVAAGGWGGAPTGPVPQPRGGQPGPGPRAPGPPQQQPWPPHPPQGRP